MDRAPAVYQGGPSISFLPLRRHWNSILSWKTIRYRNSVTREFIACFGAELSCGARCKLKSRSIPWMRIFIATTCFFFHPSERLACPSSALNDYVSTRCTRLTDGIYSKLLKAVVFLLILHSVRVGNSRSWANIVDVYSGHGGPREKIVACLVVSKSRPQYCLWTVVHATYYLTIL